MVEYSVILKRFPGSPRPDVCIFRDEDREKAIREMARYDKQHGFTIHDPDGHYTIASIHLVAKEPIVGAPILSDIPYHELFDHLGNRKPDPQPDHK